MTCRFPVNDHDKARGSAFVFWLIQTRESATDCKELGLCPTAGGTRLSWTLTSLCSELVFFAALPHCGKISTSDVCCDLSGRSLKLLVSPLTGNELWFGIDCSCKLFFYFYFIFCGEILLFPWWKQWNTKIYQVIKCFCPISVWRITLFPWFLRVLI